MYCIVFRCIPFVSIALFRLYGTKCVSCELVLSETDIVMRCTVGVYHMDCFRCFQCSRQLLPGDEYSQTKDGRLLCKADFEAMEVVQSACADQGTISNVSNGAADPTTFNNNNNNVDNKGTSADRYSWKFF